MQGMVAFITLALAIVILAAWLMAINLFINAAKEKGYYKDGGAGILWFIGIFTTPLVAGVYTTALPDSAAHIQDELLSL